MLIQTDMLPLPLPPSAIKRLPIQGHRWHIGIMIMTKRLLYDSKRFHAIKILKL